MVTYHTSVYIPSRYNKLILNYKEKKPPKLSVVVQVFNPCIQKTGWISVSLRKAKTIQGVLRQPGLHKETLSQQEKKKKKEKRKKRQRKRKTT